MSKGLSEHRQRLSLHTSGSEGLHGMAGAGMGWAPLFSMASWMFNQSQRTHSAKGTAPPAHGPLPGPQRAFPKVCSIISSETQARKRGGYGNPAGNGRLDTLHTPSPILACTYLPRTALIHLFLPSSPPSKRQNPTIANCFRTHTRFSPQPPKPSRKSSSTPVIRLNHYFSFFLLCESESVCVAVSAVALDRL